MQDEINLIVNAFVAIGLLLLVAIYNYIRTLDRETLVNDIMLLKAVKNGEHIMFKSDGKWIAVKNHKQHCPNCTCRNCDECQY